MSLLEDLEARSVSQCELCTSKNNLKIYDVKPVSTGGLDGSLLACETCIGQIDDPETTEANHWRCLNDSMWSEFQAIQVVAWRMLSRLKKEGWPQDLLDMMYLDEATEAWAKEGLPDEDAIKHVDSNGVQLQSGDSVVLIKDLKVKGGNFTAKRGTHVRNIVLVHDNANHIEGKVEDQLVVILTQYVKK